MTAAQAIKQLKLLGDQLSSSDEALLAWPLLRQLTHLLETASGTAVDLVALRQGDSLDFYPLIPWNHEVDFGLPRPLLWIPDSDDRPLWLESNCWNTPDGRGQISYQDDHIVVQGIVPLMLWRRLRRDLLRNQEVPAIPLPLTPVDQAKLLWGSRDTEHVVMAPLLRTMRIGTINRKKWTAVGWTRWAVEMHQQLAGAKLRPLNSWDQPGSRDCGSLDCGSLAFSVSRSDALTGLLEAF